MNRILTWFFGNGEQPAFYMERDYTPTHVRLGAVTAPSGGDCEIDIRDDGVSIFANRSRQVSSKTQVYSEIQYGTKTGTFTIGESVSGGTSSATGIVVSNVRGEMKLTNESVSSFTVGETITGASSGATAVIDGYKRGGRPETFSQDSAQNSAILAKGDTLNEMADDFPDAGEPILAGSVVTCNLVKSNGAGQITVQLELESLDEEDEESE